MDQLFYFARGIAFSATLLIGFRTWWNYKPQVAAELLVALCAGLAAYIIAPLFEPQSLIGSAVILGAISVPATFWFFCEAVFKDWDTKSQRLSWWHWCLLTLFLGLSFLAFRLAAAAQNDSSIFDLSFYTSNALRLGFLVLALRAIVGEWGNDLVESRRRFRTVVSAIGGTYIGLVVLVELLLRGQIANESLELANAIGLSVLLLGIAAWFLVLNPEDLFAQSPIVQEINENNTNIAPISIATGAATTTSPVLTHTERKWVLNAQEYMQQEHGYQQTSLSISALANHLQIPEHILRRLINKYLGFRNFNDFVNSYRLKAAAERLANPDEERVPILTIALDSGFASITPFNRAFKTHFRQTPSEYRQASLDALNSVQN